MSTFCLQILMHTGMPTHMQTYVLTCMHTDMPIYTHTYVSKSHRMVSQMLSRTHINAIQFVDIDRMFAVCWTYG